MRLLLISIFLLVLQVSLSLILVKPEFAQYEIEKELMSFQNNLGEQQTIKLKGRADHWFKVLFGTEVNVGGSDPWHQQPTMVLYYLSYQFLLRVSLLFFWGPVLLLILGTCVIDALTRRKAKANQFEYSAAERYRLSLRACAMLVVATMLVGCSPFAVSSFLVPVLCVLLCGSLMLVIVYSKKAF